MMMKGKVQFISITYCIWSQRLCFGALSLQWQNNELIFSHREKSRKEKKNDIENEMTDNDDGIEYPKSQHFRLYSRQT